MKLKDVCELEVACCTRDATIAQAARLMRQHHTGDLVVIDDTDGGREPIGILTDRDIVLEVVAQGRDPSRTNVNEIMSSQLVVAAISEDVETVLERMRQHGVRRMPVIDDDGNVFGILTLDDLLRIHADQAAALLSIVTKEQSREHRAKPLVVGTPACAYMRNGLQRWGHLRTWRLPPNQVRVSKASVVFAAMQGAL